VRKDYQVRAEILRQALKTHGVDREKPPEPRKVTATIARRERATKIVRKTEPSLLMSEPKAAVQKAVQNEFRLPKIPEDLTEDPVLRWSLEDEKLYWDEPGC